MKKFNGFQITGLLIVVMLTILVFVYPENNYRHDKVIIAFGDSLTRGYGVVPPNGNYVVYLSEYIKIPIINAGLTGDTTADALVRLQGEVLNKKPDIVIVFLGGNDFFNGYSADVITANLTTIIQKIHQIDAKVILVGGDTQMASEFENTFQKIAENQKVFAYIPNVLNGILFRKDLMYDDVHPNEKGHKLVAQKILPALQRALIEN